MQHGQMGDYESGSRINLVGHEGGFAAYDAVATDDKQKLDLHESTTDLRQHGTATYFTATASLTASILGTVRSKWLPNLLATSHM